MIVSPRAASQLRALEPDAVAAILDTLRDRANVPGASIAIDLPESRYRAFVARHRDGSMVLVSVSQKGTRHDRD